MSRKIRYFVTFDGTLRDMYYELKLQSLFTHMPTVALYEGYPV